MEQPGKRGSLTEVLSRINYYESAVKNPTKDSREARGHLYKELDRLGAFITNGVTNSDFDRLNHRIEPLQGTERERAGSMISVLREKAERGEIGEGDAIALIVDLNSQRTVVIRVPSRK